MPPPGGFYHHRQMETQMRLQVDAFFGDLVKTNGPIRHIIDSDHTFLNENLAKHYGIQKELKGGTQKVDGASAFHRGGVLRMGAVLTATSAPLRTSPVKRGVWAAGHWNLELSRKLDTGHDDDVVFDVRKRFSFAIAVFDDSGADHSKATRSLTLVFQR